VSKGATRNPDRRRELRPIAIPANVAAMLEPGTKAYRLGPCQVLVSHPRSGWHLSVSRKDRLPTWEEVRDARYALVPDEVTMALLLPPRAEYVNLHDYCLQAYEVPADAGKSP